jgi:hypothetical protein
MARPQSRAWRALQNSLRKLPPITYSGPTIAALQNVRVPAVANPWLRSGCADLKEKSMDDLFAALLSWAVTLSGYPAPAVMPELIAVPHSFFVANACGGQECKVYGWYAGGRKLYIDERMDPLNDTVAASVVVHEMVHYLQGISRNGGVPAAGAAFGERPGCTAAIEMEREAYGVQRNYLLSFGSFRPVGISMARVGCSDK